MVEFLRENEKAVVSSDEKTKDYESQSYSYTRVFQSPTTQTPYVLTNHLDLNSPRPPVTSSTPTLRTGSVPVHLGGHGPVSLPRKGSR